MGCIPYQTAEDASRSLRHTTVLYKGQPAYVTSLDGPPGVVTADRITLYLHFYPIKNRQRLEVLLSDPDLDVTNMRMGYLNTTQDAIWCERFPYQGLTQGLNNTNVNTKTVRVGTGNEPVYSFSDLTELADINQMFGGKYPVMGDVLAKFDTDTGLRSVAFSRVFAISRDDRRGDYLIHYKGEAAGGGCNNKGFSLGPKFKHLREQLTELGINVA